MNKEAQMTLQLLNFLLIIIIVLTIAWVSWTIIRIIVIKIINKREHERIRKICIEAEKKIFGDKDEKEN